MRSTEHLEHLLIAGKRVTGGGRDTCPVFNPATGQPVGNLTLASITDVEEAAAASATGFLKWQALSALARARIMVEISVRLRASTDAIARQLTLEQGKTTREAAAEVNGAADLFEWLAEEGKRVYGRVVTSRLPGVEQTVLHEPVGPVAAFSPWNYPLALAARKVAHALAAGCSVVVKPAEESPSAVLALADICLACGVPAEAIQVVFGVPAQVSETLIASPYIRKISFTGSVPVGMKLAAQAGGRLKKMTMELGGHSPVIIMDDADLEPVIDQAVAGKFRNAGQICISPTRFLVHEAVYERALRLFAERASTLRVGPGLDAATDMGPLAHGRRVEAMENLVHDATRRGARLIAGTGEGPSRAGYFWQPTVLADVPLDARLMQEEPFGPVAPFACFSNIDDAIAQANALEYGLAAYAFTSSLGSAQRFKHNLKAGVVGINTFGVTTPEMPFQGIKSSGIGTAMGIEGLMDHFNLKSVFLRS